jgi:hypothetical protein
MRDASENEDFITSSKMRSELTCANKYSVYLLPKQSISIYNDAA